MTNTTSPLPVTTRRPAGAGSFAAAVVCAAVVSAAVSAVIAAIAHGAGASRAFKALDFATYTPFIVVGLLAGAIAWNLIRTGLLNLRGCSSGSRPLSWSSAWCRMSSSVRRAA